MKARDLMKLVKRFVLPHLEGFRVHRSLVYAHPVDMVLRGFVFQPLSMDPNAFTVEVFAQPLYVPSDCIWYTFGKRLGWLKHRRGIWWELDISDLRQSEAVFREITEYILDVGLPFVQRLATPAGFVQYGAKASGVPKDPHVREAIAYSRILIGDYAKAARELEHLHRELIREQEDYPWMKEMAERVETISKLLQQSPEDAVRQLHEWRDWTLKQLRLEKEIGEGS
ncbi:MAG: hypothetical protein ABDI19_00655 [Armatimonadota bacterium]